MNETPKEQRRNILSRVGRESIAWRKREFARILGHANSARERNGLLLLSSGAEGASELLRQSYDELFFNGKGVVPIYFSFNESDRSAESVAKRFLQSFLLQVVAFRRNDPDILVKSPEICEVAELSIPSDGYWIDRLIDNCESNSKLEDSRGFIRNCLSAPFRAKAAGIECLLMLDDIHLAAGIDEEASLVNEIKDIYSNAAFPFIFAGRRRFLLNFALKGKDRLRNADVLKLSPVGASELCSFIEDEAGRQNVKINEQTRDLILQQFGARPEFISGIFEAARDKGISLDSFGKLQQVYVDDLLGGRAGRHFDSVFSYIAPKPENQRELIGLLYDSATAENGRASIDTWKKRCSLSEPAFYHAISALNTFEFASVNASVIEASPEDEVLLDYLRTRFRHEFLAEPRALIVADCLSNALKRSSALMARYYRRERAIGLKELLGAFDCQKVPAALLDYSDFKERFKGECGHKISESLESVEEKAVMLPQIVYTANCASFYSPIRSISDDERCAVALGFESGSYTDENESVWIAAEIDSKLEAQREVAEFWCDRLEMVAVMCGFSRYKIWLIAPEGFSDEASASLRERKAYGSSRRQAEMIAGLLRAENAAKPDRPPNEYEMVVPMGEDTELIAAHAVEEIARRHNFKPGAINQMKTALVEACINASEHSLSPDRKIYQKFTIEEGRMVITITNRGIKIPQSKIDQSYDEDESGRRGWGLKLMRSLMDEVEFAQTDDGTSISMVKYLRP